MKSARNSNLLKIGEVAKGAGVSVSTIHYYMQQGLLTPPVKKSRNMAYYDPQTVEEIKLIQELQTKKYLPLSAIRVIIQAKRDGQDTGHIGEMHDFMAEVFQPVGNVSTPKNVSLAELIAASALPESSITKLEKTGLLAPVKGKSGSVYTDIDILIAQGVKKLLDYGFKLTDLEIFREQIAAIRKETSGLHEMFHRLPDHEAVPLKELFRTYAAIKGQLRTRIIREEMGHYRGLGFKEKKK